MAFINKRSAADGSARYDVRYRDPSGRLRTKTFKRRKDADLYAANTETDKNRGNWIDPNAGKVSLKEYADKWVLERTTSRGKRLAPRTVELYVNVLEKQIYPTFGEMDINRITSAAVRSWNSKQVGTGHHSQAAKAYRLLRTILGTAVKDDLITKNPCNIDGGGIERSAERPVATADEVWALVDAIDDNVQLFVLIAAFVGLRFSEIAGLECRHVDLLHRTIKVEQQLERVSKKTAELLGIETIGFGDPKSDAGFRTLTVPAPLVPYLEAQLAKRSADGPTGLLIVGPQGGTVSNSGFSPKFTKAKKKTGVDKAFRFHDLRHTHMTMAAESGASTAELMRRLGQSSPDAALRYQHATDKRDAKIADSVGESLARPKKDERDGCAKDDLQERPPA